MDVHATFDQDYAETQLRRASNPLRRAIKFFYLRNVLQEISGPTIDFGCGAGQLLQRLPSGSIGLEGNRFLVQKLQDQGMNVRLYESSVDRFSLREMHENEFEYLVLSHVLEHMPNAADILRAFCRSCNRIKIDTIILVVPGAKGYATDATHMTFVDMAYLQAHDLLTCEGYSVVKANYFPINVAIAGEYFAYNELMIVYHRTR